MLAEGDIRLRDLVDQAVRHHGLRACGGPLEDADYSAAYLLYCVPVGLEPSGDLGCRLDLLHRQLRMLVQVDVQLLLPGVRCVQTLEDFLRCRHLPTPL